MVNASNITRDSTAGQLRCPLRRIETVIFLVLVALCSVIGVNVAATLGERLRGNRNRGNRLERF